MSGNSYSLVEAMVYQFINKIKNDPEKLVTFGMNIGYNSCTKGAETIRRIE